MHLYRPIIIHVCQGSVKMTYPVGDALLYKLYYSKSNTTQEDATIKVNHLTKSEPSSRQALAKKESKIPLAIYEQLSNTLHKLTKKHIYNNHTKQIIAVDGTYPAFLSSLSKDGYKPNKNKHSVTPLVTGLYNVSYNFPITLELAKKKNEISAFMDIIKNKSEYKNNIFIFDRGYNCVSPKNYLKNCMNGTCFIFVD